MKLYEKDNLVILEEVENFDVRAIFTCGQAFRWYEESDGSFTTVHLGRVLNVLNENGRVVLTAGVPVGVSGTTNIIRVYSKTNNII